MTAYRESAEEKPVRAYVVPDKSQHQVIFLDSIIMLEVTKVSNYWRLEYYLVGRTIPMNYEYPTEDEARKELKTVAEAKQRWDEHKARLAGKIMMDGHE